MWGKRKLIRNSKILKLLRTIERRNYMSEENCIEIDDQDEQYYEKSF